MLKNQVNSNENKVNLINDIYNQALNDIEKIKKERDKKIKNVLKEIDKKHVAKALRDIKNSK
ncbi:MAG TPA: hypothetical protein PKI61_01310 [bacterium]|nr:hypothetical protein [bacterium]HPT29526.1 hypothetical protein [bacterium]